MSRSKGLRNAPYPIPGILIGLQNSVLQLCVFNIKLMLNCELFYIAKPVASLLSIWTTQLNAKASAGHPEFKGRITCQSNRAELYTFMKSGSDR